MLLLTSIICQVLFFRLLFQRHAFVKTAGAHPHSPLTCWALRRAWGAISSRALSPPAKAAKASGTSEFSPTGPKALREPGSWHLIQESWDFPAFAGKRLSQQLLVLRYIMVIIA